MLKTRCNLTIVQQILRFLALFLTHFQSINEFESEAFFCEPSHQIDLNLINCVLAQEDYFLILPVGNTIETNF